MSQISANLHIRIPEDGGRFTNMQLPYFKSFGQPEYTSNTALKMSLQRTTLGSSECNVTALYAIYIQANLIFLQKLKCWLVT